MEERGLTSYLQSILPTQTRATKSLFSTAEAQGKGGISPEDYASEFTTTIDSVVVCTALKIIEGTEIRRTSKRYALQPDDSGTVSLCNLRNDKNCCSALPGTVIQKPILLQENVQFLQNLKPKTALFVCIVNWLECR